MDVVYLVKKTKQKNLELRYSLRSLSNIEHDKVWIVWEWLRWIKNIVNIYVSDWGFAFDNVVNKLKVVCDNENISEDFIFMHDDIFILKPLQKIIYYHRGTLKWHKDLIEKKFWKNRYYDSINSVYEKFEDWLSYDLHVPIIFNKKKLKHILETYWVYDWSKRSIYCNYYDVWWKMYPKWDCKVSKNIDWLDLDQDYLSCDDKVWVSIEFIGILEELFPYPSKYESLDYNYYQMDKVKVRLNKSLYPYKAGQECELKISMAEKWEKRWYLEIIKSVWSNKFENKSMEWRLTKQDKSIEDYRAEYKAKFDKDVSKNKKNDIEWIKSKIYS